MRRGSFQPTGERVEEALEIKVIPPCPRVKHAGNSEVEQSYLRPRRAIDGVVRLLQELGNFGRHPVCLLELTLEFLGFFAEAFCLGGKLRGGWSIWETHFA